MESYRHSRCYHRAVRRHSGVHRGYTIKDAHQYEGFGVIFLLATTAVSIPISSGLLQLIPCTALYH